MFDHVSEVCLEWKNNRRYFWFAGCSTYYRSDTKAFIFSLNYTSEGSLFKKKISGQSAATAIYSSPSTGPTFGQAPFDFQIGDSDNMKTGFSHHVVSYEGGGGNAESNLDTVLAGASIFEPSDVEVLYKGHGGTLLHWLLSKEREHFL